MTGATTPGEAGWVDVLIVGAGVSGIGAACHLRRLCPGRSFAIVEARDAIGGTWDLFRYPGIRSDSDMHTFGYSFKPWRNPKAIADGDSILAYLDEAVAENGLGAHMRFGRRVTAAAWDTVRACWTVTDVDGAGNRKTTACRFLFVCAGYYDYETPHRADIPGIGDFAGRVLHPQFWPHGLDCTGKRIAVIGSGATAMTLVPALASEAARVHLIQRSPTYVVSRPDEDGLANWLGRVLPDRLGYALSRWKNVLLQQMFYRRARSAPEAVRRFLLERVRRDLGPEHDIEPDFAPAYDPWDQRICLIPNADLFDAIRRRRVAVHTGQIERVVPHGVQLASGRMIQADTIVTATGLNLSVLGKIVFEVDGEPVSFADRLTYLGMMYEGVPNLATVFGYVNASWTLRADLNAEYVCRILARMDELGMRQCTPRLAPGDLDMERRPFIVDFTPGYIARALHRLPKQGSRDPWRNTQNYLEDRRLMRRAPLDEALTFDNPAPASGA